MLSTRDEHHAAASKALGQERQPHIVPAAALGEVGYMVGVRLGEVALRPLVQALDGGILALDCGERDFARVGELLARYGDLRLGLVDAAVIACAERNGGRVMTFDRRDMRVVAREKTIVIVPAVV